MENFYIFLCASSFGTKEWAFVNWCGKKASDKKQVLMGLSVGNYLKNCHKFFHKKISNVTIIKCDYGNYSIIIVWL